MLELEGMLGTCHKKVLFQRLECFDSCGDRSNLGHHLELALSLEIVTQSVQATRHKLLVVPLFSGSDRLLHNEFFPPLNEHFLYLAYI